MLKLSDLEMETPRNENKIAFLKDSINHFNTQLGETQKKMEETEVNIVNMKRNVPVEGTNSVLEKG
jgi:peptidoglycan hydrolase CwlO-like protein